MASESRNHEASEATQPREVDLTLVRLMPHVEQALRIASYLAQARASDDPKPVISAGDILRAVQAVHQQGSMHSESEAFETLRQVLPNIADVDPGASLPELPDRILVTGALAERLETILDRSLDAYGKDAQISVWGRDLVTIALLASKDPSLATVVDIAGRAVGVVRKLWLEFLSKDMRPDRSPWAETLRTFLERLQERESGAFSIDAGWHPLVEGFSPEWADGWGEDSYGPWVSFMVGSVETLLRWIPPGQFLMGSPPDDPGYRAVIEGFAEYKGTEEPQTEISHLNGFWLMDAPVTQALWDAVMGAKAQSDHPNRFPDPERPVEMVSWDDAQTFLTHVNGLVPGLDLRLPSESEWEYACRAATDTATYAGPMEILGDRNAPVLDEIAWYGGNSGVGFDLEDGFDSSGWQGKQHPHERAGTRKVKHRQPNGWGCHDMLGNVWEWCADVWSDTHEGADPLGGARQASQQEDGGGTRVMRGGSWSSIARNVRSACRDGIDPAVRSDDIGFRCARGHASTGTSGEVRSGREAEPRPGETEN